MSRNEEKQKERLKAAEEDMERFLKSLHEEYDLQSAKEFLQRLKPDLDFSGELSFANLFGLKEDHEGGDVQVCIDGKQLDMYGGDKKRDDQQNKDLGIEFNRSYCWCEDDLVYAYGAGRDLRSHPPVEIGVVYDVERNIMITTITDDASKKTNLDFYILRRSGEDPMLIDAKPIKELCEDLLEQSLIKHKKLIHDIKRAFGPKGVAADVTRFFDHPEGVTAIKIVNETDTKDVNFGGKNRHPNTELVFCIQKHRMVCKIIVYINIPVFFAKNTKDSFL